MIELPFLTEHAPFPAVTEALDEPNGLLAFGGSLSVNRLYNAYFNGIFPWFSADEPILWWSPNPRAIIHLDKFHGSRSLRKLARQGHYQVTLNYSFDDVLDQCATIARVNPSTGLVSSDTWITKEMRQAYIQLHEAGLAHSVEVWEGRTLVGGLYGVAVGDVFCGESMFHRQPNTSKLAMLGLVTHMQKHDMAFIDCQLPTEHLASLGAEPLPRKEFIALLMCHNQTLTDEGTLSERYRRNWCQRSEIL